MRFSIGFIVGLFHTSIQHVLIILVKRIALFAVSVVIRRDKGETKKYDAEFVWKSK